MMDSMQFVQVVPKCKKHPKYGAKRKPKADCIHCKLIWNVQTYGCRYGERCGENTVSDHLGRCMGCQLGDR